MRDIEPETSGAELPIQDSPAIAPLSRETPEAGPSNGSPQSALAGDEDAPAPHITWLDVSAPEDDKLTSDVLGRWRPRRAGWSVALERIALWFERPVSRITGYELNPLYHTGTLAIFLLLLVGVTGFYLFLFFQYGFEASYQAVARMESQPIARTIRAIHRYASVALVIVTLLHAYRTLFLEKFKGPRWLAWVTGVVMTVMLVVAGITGYWLIWDERALMITTVFREMLTGIGNWQARFMSFLTYADERGQAWAFFLAILAAHILLFLMTAGFFYLHIRRLRRPKWLPPVQWVALVAVALLVVGILFPAGLLPPAAPDRLPAAIAFDPIFLPFLAFPVAAWPWYLLIVVALLVAALPIINALVGRQRHAGLASASGVDASPTARILTDRCTGCTRCALDCPYGAIEMITSPSGRSHKLVAREIPRLCVGCGICIGSCDAVAVTLGDAAPESLWEQVRRSISHEGKGSINAVAPQRPAHDLQEIEPDKVVGRRVVFTCDRHSRHGAAPYLSSVMQNAGSDSPMVIALPCVGAVPPDLIGRVIDSGAFSVQVVGCPPNDCAAREGNEWTAQRLSRRRPPRLRRAYLEAPPIAAWLPPDAFAMALDPTATDRSIDDTTVVSAQRQTSRRNLRRFALTLLLLIAGVLGLALLTRLPTTPYPRETARIQLVSPNLGQVFGGLTADRLADERFTLRLTIDGEERIARVLTAEELTGTSAVFFDETALSPGAHEISLNLTGETTGNSHVLRNEEVTLEPAQVYRPDMTPFAYPQCLPVPIPGGRNPCAD